MHKLTNCFYSTPKDAPGAETRTARAAGSALATREHSWLLEHAKHLPEADSTV